MLLKPISQCSKCLDFLPRRPWPQVFPALAWRGHLLTGFHRPPTDMALELDDGGLVDAYKAAYPELGLSELARLLRALEATFPEYFLEFRNPLCTAYSLRWSDRLGQTIQALLQTQLSFQTWVDDKKLGPRDLSPLLALPEISEFLPYTEALARLPISKVEGVRALELGVELFLLGRPLNDLLPSTDSPSLYLRRLEQWRRPRTSENDEAWRTDVAQWPWPAQVQGQWQRFGDQAGLEIKIRTTSADDLKKKLERLNSIGETWSCKS
ncbi:MAG: hypothetical protein KF799_16125 [Bdellovibrionales bacterium]|nr:hypothetical protein [Bdellovibrionales bacterium]